MSEFGTNCGAFLAVTATDVTCTVERKAAIPRDLSGRDAARAIAALLLQERGDWVLRDNATGTYLRDGDRVGDTLSRRGASLTLITRARLGSV